MLSLKNVSFARANKHILSIPELSFDPSQFTVILGHNGSGKSTLLQLLAGQLKPTAGDICLHDRPIHTFSARELAQTIAFLPQSLPDAAGLTVRELVGLGRFAWRGLLGRWTDRDHLAVQQAMLATGVELFAEQLSSELSGGERQRVWISMLLAQESPILLLDEPTSALDLAFQYDVLKLLSHLNKSYGKGVIVILHDINLATRYADRIVAIRQGQLFFDGSSAELLRSPRLPELYGVPFKFLPLDGELPIAVVAAS